MANSRREGPYRTGELDQRITFQRPIKVADGMGGATHTWEDVAGPMWAHIRPMRGSERDLADRQNSETKYFCVIRYRKDIEPTWRVVWHDRDRAFRITFIADPGVRNQYLPLEMDGGVAT